MKTVAVTGSGSGIGAALTERLTAAGDRVIGIDVKNAEVQADLGTPEGRAQAIDRVAELSDGAIDGLVTCAGLNGIPDRPASLLIAVNYFGTVDLLAGLRPLLANGTEPAAVAISSNGTTCSPGVNEALIAACLAGDEDAAKAQAGEGESVSTYPVTKTALAWWVRRQAVTQEWAGSGITLNAVAPGAVHTPLLQEGIDDPTIGPLIAAFQAPIGRNGQPEEIAALLQYLLGPDARFFCGSILFCDGGMDAQLRSDDWPTPWRPG